MRIYIGNISKDIDEIQLAELFAPYGKPESVHLATRGSTGPSRGFGFVELTDAAEAAAAMTALDGKEINGQVLKVNEARPKNPTHTPS